MVNTLLQLLDEPQRQHLLETSINIELDTGECLFSRGQQADHVFLVNRGKVTLYRLKANGEEKIFKVFLAGGLIAEMAVFMNPRRYPMSAVTNQPTSLTALYYQDIYSILRENPDLSLRVMQFMSNRICQLMNNLDIVTQVNASQRLVMRFAELYRNQRRHDGKLTLPCTKRVLAMQLGVTPETLSRLLNKMKKDGLIGEHGNCISIPQFEHLCQSVELEQNIFLTNQ